MFGQLLPGKSTFAPGKPVKVNVAVKDVAAMGRGGDTELAHVTPAEKRMLKEKGGSGTINPKTGLREFFGGEGGGGSMGRDDGRVGGDRDDDRPSRSYSPPSNFHNPRTAPKGRIDTRDEIDKAKARASRAAGPGEDQRDGRIQLDVTVQVAGKDKLGPEESGKAAEERRRKRQGAVLLSGSEGIRDKLGRSGKRPAGQKFG